MGMAVRSVALMPIVSSGIAPALNLHALRSVALVSIATGLGHVVASVRPPSKPAEPPLPAAPPDCAEPACPPSIGEEPPLPAAPPDCAEPPVPAVPPALDEALPALPLPPTPREPATPADPCC